MDKDGFDKSPTHPVRAPKSTKIEIPDNVTNLPGMGMRRARLFKNNLLDAVLGPEQGESNDHDEEMPPEVAERFKDHLDSLMEKDRTESHLDNYINSSIENSGQSHELNQMLGRNNNDFHEARIISMGKFKEDKANRELMGKHDE
jgi:hypothetical protein